MILGLKGIVEYKEPNVVHINVNNVVYEVFISLNTFSEIKDNEVKIFTTHIIREDSQILYGFLDKSEKSFFDKLLKINGVGPKVAITICSTYTAQEFSKLISNKDIDGIKKVPGIGPKSASRILVELNGFEDEIILNNKSEDKSIEDAVVALESLGFKKSKINEVLKDIEETDTPLIIKKALKKLNNF